jgi:hypothetical protein
MSTADDDDDDVGGAVSRGPRGVPAMSLREAVDKVRAIYNADKNAGSPIDAAVRHMGYKGRSGPANAALAALRRFGLVDSRAGRVVPTSRAIAIIKLPETDARRKDALRDAVLAPPIYKGYVDQYSLTGLPSKDSFEHELLMDGRFNHNRIPDVVKDFYDSLQFAGLIDSSGILLTATEATDGIDDDAESGDEVEDHGQKQTDKDRDKGSPKPPPGTRDFPLYTSSAKGALYVPSRMSKKDFGLLKLQIENSLAVIEATGVDDQAE